MISYIDCFRSQITCTVMQTIIYMEWTLSVWTYNVVVTMVFQATHNLENTAD